MRRLRRSPLALIPPRHSSPPAPPVPDLFENTLKLSHCYFCHTAPRGEYVLTAEVEASLPAREDGDSRQRLLLPLCAVHQRVLQRAGKPGRVHGPTGVRWWLGVR